VDEIESDCVFASQASHLLSKHHSSGNQPDNGFFKKHPCQVAPPPFKPFQTSPQRKKIATFDLAANRFFASNNLV
jgi:hypothetical protein